MELAALYLKLFIAFFKIGLFGFGGGYAMLPLIQEEVVDYNHWMTVSTFTDIVAISQTTPGPLSFNIATFIGYQAVDVLGYPDIYGIIGSVICTLAVSLPSFIIIGILFAFFLKTFNENLVIKSVMYVLRYVILGLIASAAIMMMTKDTFINVYNYLIFIIAFILCMKKMNPIYIIVLAGIAGWLLF